MKRTLKTILITAILAIVVNHSFAQDEKIAEYEDGTSVAFSVLDSTIDHMKRLRIAGEVYYTAIESVTGGVFANYFDPKDKFMVEANYQVNKTIGLDGAYFFMEKKGMTPFTLPLKYLQTGYNTATVYNITTNVQHVTFFGVDAGYSQLPLNYQSRKWHNFYDNQGQETYYSSATNQPISTVYITTPSSPVGEIAIGPELAFAEKYRMLEHEVTGPRKGLYGHGTRTNVSKDKVNKDDDGLGEPAKDQSVHINSQDYFGTVSFQLLVFSNPAVDTTGFGAVPKGVGEDVPKLPLSNIGFRLSYGGGYSHSLGHKANPPELGWVSDFGVEKNNAGWNLRIWAGLFLAF